MIICIGREFGSGGHEIGRILAKKLGLELYDRDLIDKAAEKIVAMPKEVLEKADEKKHNPWLHQVWYDVPNQELNGMTANDTLHQAYSSIIRELAGKENCVFVGRCADYALSDNPDCINIFIHADLDVRIKNVSRNLNITENKARDIINKTDKQRASYYNYYTSKKWGDSKSYNLSLDAGKLGTDNCVEMILKFRELMDTMK